MGKNNGPVLTPSYTQAIIFLALNNQTKEF